jgi:uncharacterized membrane protein YfcA
MDGVVLGLFLLGAFLGGLVSGLSGFAMGIVVSGLWLHVLTPIQNAVLIVGYAMLTQGYGVWKVRHALNWRIVAPFIIGGAIGVPLGTLLLTAVNPAHLRTAVGVLLVLYSLYGLARPAFKAVQAGVVSDAVVGALNGFLGGLTGLTGIIMVIWSQWRGWSKDAQRAAFQPVNFVAATTALVAFAIVGGVTVETTKLYAFGLPLMLLGLWSGFKLYGHLDDAAFRKVILVLLLIAGATLIAPAFR